VSVELKYDLYSDAFRVSTYATFAEMRERDPVLCQPGIDGETPLWFVTRYHMLNKDGDDHRRLRRLVTKAFTPRMVERLRPRIQEIADELIDRVEARGEMGLVEEFAFPFPITVIAELLGVPAADRDRFRTWSNAIVTPALAADDVARFGELMQEFVDYLRALFEQRRRERGEDLISALVAVEEGGDTLDESELSSMVALLSRCGARDDGQLHRERDARAAPASGAARRARAEAGAPAAGDRGAYSLLSRRAARPARSGGGAGDAPAAAARPQACGARRDARVACGAALPQPRRAARCVGDGRLAALREELRPWTSGNLGPGPGQAPG